MSDGGGGFFSITLSLIPDVRLGAALKALHVTSGFAIETEVKSSEAVEKLIKTFPQENPVEA